MHWGDRIGRRLKLRDLHILLAVAQSGSMSKAASLLAVSNPVVSKAIADLEHTLGVRLLDRNPHGVEPTIYARALLDRGLIAFDELRQAVKHIEFLANPAEGELRIGASSSLALGFLTAVLDQLSRSHPRIVFHLVVGETGASYRTLGERKVDLAILHMFTPNVDEHMNVEVLYDEAHSVVAGAQNPWARRRKVELADLMDEPWTLSPPDSPFGAMVVEAFRARGLDLPRTTIVTPNVPVRNALLASGRFLTVMPNSVLTLPVKNAAIKRLPIDLPTTHIPVGTFTLKNRTLNPVAQLFIDCAREHAKALTKRK